MKKTLLALSLASFATAAFSAQNLVKTDNGRVYADGYARFYFVQNVKYQDLNAEKTDYKKDTAKKIASRLRLGLGAEYNFKDQGSAGVYFRFQKDFYSSQKETFTYAKQVGNVLLENVRGKQTRAHNDTTRPDLVVARTWVNFKDIGRLTLGLKGTSDAAGAKSYGSNAKLVSTASTAFSSSTVGVKRVALFETALPSSPVKVGISYADSKTATNTDYARQVGAYAEYSAKGNTVGLSTYANQQNKGAFQLQTTKGLGVELRYSFSYAGASVDTAVSYSRTNDLVKNQVDQYKSAGLALGYTVSSYFKPYAGVDYLASRLNKAGSNLTSGSNQVSYYGGFSSTLGKYLGVSANLSLEYSRVNTNTFNNSKAYADKYTKSGTNNFAALLDFAL